MVKYSLQEINSIAKDMKYEALYWTLGFVEIKKGVFIKEYNSKLIIKIFSEKAYVDFSSKIAVVNGDYLRLNSHKSFVILECVDKLLTMGYSPSEIIIDLNNEYDIYCKNLYIKCYEWNHLEKDKVVFKNKLIRSISYSSRLTSGVIERVTSIKTTEGLFEYGIFENEFRKNSYNLYNAEEIKDKDFIIKGTTAVKYLGSEKIVNIPEGITDLRCSLFWDNQVIEEVHLPNSLINLGGDTFYNCSNLKRVTIPQNVRFMGNNPFAGCPNIEIINNSSFFNYVDGVLYTKDYSKLIYCSIKKSEENYVINNQTKIIGKHSFYLCNNLKEITIPQSVIKLENNPFSGCRRLNIVNNSSNYHIINKIIYDKEKKSVIGCLNSINCEELKLLNVERICRNSFWNCKGINKIILPKTLKVIGYNPFVGCSNIEFVSHSEEFIIDNGALLTKDKKRLICYPSKFARGEVHLPEEVITLERGAFSGCDKMTKINLHNVSIISKTCFTNCNSLEKVYCSDLVGYIGEWAFAHCQNLKEISVYKDCFLDNNSLLNSKTNLIVRKKRTNYLFESDNQYTLESMQKTYKGKIDSILIDPPYNSHIDYIGYQDGNYDNGYLSFMEKRIELSYKLLSNKGFLVINIDEGEVNNLTNLCKKYFKNIKIYRWKKKHEAFDFNRVILNPNKIQTDYEYIIICKKTEKAIFNKIMQPYFENGILKERISEIPETFDCFGTTSSAKDEINNLFGKRDYFSTPKPVKLMKELIRATTNKKSLIMDYFAGSGTVGEACLELNKEDGGNRKFILVCNNESNICKEVTKRRLEIINAKFEFVY